MICPYCKQEHPTSAIFCPETGQRLEQAASFCPDCGMHLTGSDLSFCPQCGQALKDQTAPDPEIEFPSTPNLLLDNRGSRWWLWGVLLGIGLLWVLVVAGLLIYRLLPEVGFYIAWLANQPETITTPQDLPPLQPSATSGIAQALQSATPNPTVTLGPSITLSSIPTPAEPVSPHEGWIVYAYGFEDEREIFLSNPITGQALQITSNTYVDEAPSFSPDGTRIVFASYRPPGGWELYVFDLNHQTEKQITDFQGQARFPSWSPVPGDERILFVGRQEMPGFLTNNVWMINADGSGLQQLTQSDADTSVSWSPDGQQLLFGRSTIDSTADGKITTSDNLDLFILDLASGNLRNITNTPNFDDFNSNWSPDGEWIVMCSVRKDENGDGYRNLDDSVDLYLIRPDGRDEQRLDINNQLTFNPMWSSDSKWILFGVKFSENKFEIWAYNQLSGEIKKLTDSGPFFHPEWAR
jgi:Tol biopolymer transport system component